MFTIGEFSKLTTFSSKTLRYYDEIGLLSPKRNNNNEYRYYSEQDIEKAYVISQLKYLGFSLKQIQTIIENHNEDTDIFEYLLEQIDKLNKEITENKIRITKMKQIIEKEKILLSKINTNKIEEKFIEDIFIAFINKIGPYTECSYLYKNLGKTCNTNITGKSGMLLHDEEYKEQANYDAYVQIKKHVEYPNPIKTKKIKGGKAITLIHKGAYSNLNKSYQSIIKYVKQKNLEIIMPTREVYIKGPGMIFRGNPNKYITEIQFLIK